MRGHPDYTNKDYVLGGNYETIVDTDGIYKVVMKLSVKLAKPLDFGIYKCIAKNALGASEEIIKVLREFMNDEKSFKLVTRVAQAPVKHCGIEKLLGKKVEK